MKLSPATTLAAVIVIGAVGFFVGRLSSTAPTAASDADTQRLATRSSSRSADAADHSSALSKRAGRSDTRREATANGHSEDSLKRLESIVRGENVLDRSRALLAFIDQLAPSEFAAAIAHFRSLGITESRFGEYGMLLTAWSQVDPLAALTYAKDNTRTGFATTTILASWAATDPEAAIRWAEANHTGTDANPYLAGIIRTLGATDPARASSLLTGMPRSQERGEALAAMLPHILAQGPEATRSWISALTDESLRNGSMMSVADKLAQTDPKGTADWLLANPGEASKSRLDDVLGTWAATNEKAALAYFQALPKGEARSNALRGVVTAVATQNATAAASMIDRYASDVTDGTIQTFVWHSFGSDPALAANYIGRLSNPDEQEHMYSRTLDTWLNQDPAAAQAWIQKNALPEKVLRRLQDKAAEGKQ
ncbi:MAG: hypothetical protein NTW21_43185 [Verrucomicrobia bacterium]|nr:hypothetical protein [Verrucomicrobiota bacterium]